MSNQYPSQLKLHKQWEEEIERLNTKYNLDCFSDSEHDSESDEGEEYKYEYNYETLIYQSIENIYTVPEILLKSSI